MNILIVGCGDIGIRCAKILIDAGHQVTGVRRRASALPDWLPGQSADVNDPATLGFLADEPAEVVIYILSAAAFNEHDYRAAYVTGVKNTLAALAVNPNKIRRFIFVSSTGVYHQNDGSEVNEDSPVEPLKFNGQLMLQGEQLVHQTGTGTCVRFSGIYGPDRLRMINRVAAGQGSGSTSLSNRIHVDDCAAVLAHLVSLCASGHELDELYLASDSAPASTHDVESFIAETLGLTQEPSQADYKQKRIAGSKRCNNKRLLDTGYQFIYPDYKAGYRQIIEGL